MKKTVVLALTGILFLIGAERSEAQSGFQRGSLLCVDFEEAERLHDEGTEDPANLLIYARCLMARGENDIEALYLLERLRDDHNDVYAAFLTAEFARSGGTFTDGAVITPFIDQALQGYHEVVKLVDGDDAVTGELHRSIESFQPIEMVSRYYIPLIYLLKFEFGYWGMDKVRRVQSPSYSGEGVNVQPLELSSRFYTLIHLEDTMRYAAQCAEAPEKEYFRSAFYEGYKEKCLLLADVTRQLMPLEEQRLSNLAQENCLDIVTAADCPEYHKLTNEILGILTRRSALDSEITTRMAIRVRQENQAAASEEQPSTEEQMLEVQMPEEKKENSQ